jgi:hypothetical protein
MGAGGGGGGGGCGWGGGGGSGVLVQPDKNVATPALKLRLRVSSSVRGWARKFMGSLLKMSYVRHDCGRRKEALWQQAMNF